MLTVEIKVNGALIGLAYARNVAWGDLLDTSTYKWQYYRPEGSPNLLVGEVEHKRDDGAEALVRKILETPAKGEGEER